MLRKVLVPCTKRLPTVIPPVDEALVKKRAVVDAVEAKKLVDVLLVIKPSVLNKLVEVLLVSTEEDAKIFSVYVLRNLSALVPRERVTSVVGRISPATVRRDVVVVAKVEVPDTARVLRRAVTAKRLEVVALVVDALITKRLVVVALVPVALVKKRLPTVRPPVEEATRKERLVVLAYTEANKVVVALSITEEEALR
jgi:hypothetical protein